MTVHTWNAMDLSQVIQMTHLRERRDHLLDPGPGQASAWTQPHRAQGTDFSEAVSTTTTTHQGALASWAAHLGHKAAGLHWGSFLLSPATLPRRMSFTDTFFTLVTLSRAGPPTGPRGASPQT